MCSGRHCDCVSDSRNSGNVADADRTTHNKIPLPEALAASTFCDGGFSGFSSPLSYVPARESGGEMFSRDASDAIMPAHVHVSLGGRLVREEYFG